MTTHRREARAAARQLLLGASPEQIDMWCMPRESRAHCVDRLLKIIANHPYEAMVWMGGA
jgi:hypothetical protein